MRQKRRTPTSVRPRWGFFDPTHQRRTNRGGAIGHPVPKGMYELTAQPSVVEGAGERRRCADALTATTSMHRAEEWRRWIQTSSCCGRGNHRARPRPERKQARRRRRTRLHFASLRRVLQTLRRRHEPRKYESIRLLRRIELRVELRRMRADSRDRRNREVERLLLHQHRLRHHRLNEHGFPGV